MSTKHNKEKNEKKRIITSHLNHDEWMHELF